MTLHPWQRNMVALKYGITLKPRPEMKFVADVRVLGFKKYAENEEPFSIELEADTPHTVARMVADIAAHRRYGDHGQSGFMQQQPTKGGVEEFFVSIGEVIQVYPQHILKGVTIAIRLRHA